VKLLLGTRYLWSRASEMEWRTRVPSRDRSKSPKMKRQSPSLARKSRSPLAARKAFSEIMVSSISQFAVGLATGQSIDCDSDSMDSDSNVPQSAQKEKTVSPKLNYRVAQLKRNLRQSYKMAIATAANKLVNKSEKSDEPISGLYRKLRPHTVADEPRSELPDRRHSVGGDRKFTVVTHQLNGSEETPTRRSYQTAVNGNGSPENNATGFTSSRRSSRESYTDLDETDSSLFDVRKSPTAPPDYYMSMRRRSSAPQIGRTDEAYPCDVSPANLPVEYHSSNQISRTNRAARGVQASYRIAIGSAKDEQPYDASTLPSVPLRLKRNRNLQASYKMAVSPYHNSPERKSDGDASLETPSEPSSAPRRLRPSILDVPGFTLSSALSLPPTPTSPTRPKVTSLMDESSEFISIGRLKQMSQDSEGESARSPDDLPDEIDPRRLRVSSSNNTSGYHSCTDSSRRSSALHSSDSDSDSGCYESHEVRSSPTLQRRRLGRKVDSVRKRRVEKVSEMQRLLDEYERLVSGSGHASW